MTLAQNCMRGQKGTCTIQDTTVSQEIKIYPPVAGLSTPCAQYSWGVPDPTHPCPFTPAKPRNGARASAQGCFNWHHSQARDKEPKGISRELVSPLHFSIWYMQGEQMEGVCLRADFPRSTGPSRPSTLPHHFASVCTHKTSPHTHHSIMHQLSADNLPPSLCRGLLDFYFFTHFFVGTFRERAAFSAPLVLSPVDLFSSHSDLGKREMAYLPCHTPCCL